MPGAAALAQHFQQVAAAAAPGHDGAAVQRVCAQLGEAARLADMATAALAPAQASPASELCAFAPLRPLFFASEHCSSTA